MASGKEIRGKIKSVENTKKITKAMEMVAASKMRKAARNFMRDTMQVGDGVLFYHCLLYTSPSPRDS